MWLVLYAVSPYIMFCLPQVRMVMKYHDICPSKWADFCHYRNLSLLFHGWRRNLCGFNYCQIIIKDPYFLNINPFAVRNKG